MRLQSQHKNYSLILVILALIGVSVFTADTPKQQPIIGIYTQSDQGDEPTMHNAKTSSDFHSYIAASYIKFIEMSGAQVVPVFAYSTPSQISALLPKLNGFLFPGGGEQFNIQKRWTSNANLILTWAMQQNDKGNPFPVWGTCLGFQLLAYLTANHSNSVISPVRGQVAILNTVQFPQSKGYIFGDMPDKIMQKVTTGQGITYYNHHYALLKSTYLSNKLLNDFWTVTGQTTTSFNELFVTVMQAKKYPFYAVQFHPEKSIYEWKVFADKSYDSIQMVQIMSNKFVEKCRQNKNSITSEDLSAKSIWNYNTQPTKMSFSRIYLFNETRPTEDLLVETKGLVIENPEGSMYEKYWGTERKNYLQIDE